MAEVMLTMEETVALEDAGASARVIAEVRKIVQERMAEAWDAGFGEGQSDGAGYPSESNPYEEARHG